MDERESLEKKLLYANKKDGNCELLIRREIVRCKQGWKLETSRSSGYPREDRGQSLFLFCIKDIQQRSKHVSTFEPVSRFSAIFRTRLGTCDLERDLDSTRTSPPCSESYTRFGTAKRRLRMTQMSHVPLRLAVHKWKEECAAFSLFMVEGLTIEFCSKKEQFVIP